MALSIHVLLLLHVLHAATAALLFGAAPSPTCLSRCSFDFRGFALGWPPVQHGFEAGVQPQPADAQQCQRSIRPAGGSNAKPTSRLRPALVSEHDQCCMPPWLSAAAPNCIEFTRCA